MTRNERAFHTFLGAVMTCLFLVGLLVVGPALVPRHTTPRMPSAQAPTTSTLPHAECTDSDGIRYTTSAAYAHTHHLNCSEP